MNIKVRDRIMMTLETAGYAPNSDPSNITGMSRAVIEEAAFPGLGESDDGDVLLLTLHRANRLLDRRKDMIFAQHLNITTRGEAERALVAYGQSYMMKLPLSLDAIQELSQGLVDVLRRFKVPASEALTNLSKGQFELTMLDENLEDDDIDWESNRILPDL